MKSGTKFNVRLLVHLAVLIAMAIVLSRFVSIPLPTMRIGFGFVPIAICGMMYGPVWAAIVAAVADVLGAMIFYFGSVSPGITLSAALTGVVFGLFLYKGAEPWTTVSWVKLAAAVGINCLIISLLLTTLWLSMLYGTPYLALLPTRLLQSAIMIPVQIIVLRVLNRPIMLYSKTRLAA